MKKLNEVVGALERLENAGYTQISKGDFRCGLCTAIQKENNCRINHATVNPGKGCCNKFYPQGGAEGKDEWPDAVTAEDVVEKLRNIKKRKEGAWSLMSEPAREALFRKTPADRYAADTRSMLKKQQHKLPTDIPESK